MRKNTRGLFAALLFVALAGSLLVGRMTYAANGESGVPEPEVILTPVEYDAAADTMTFEISTNREDVGIAYIEAYYPNEELLFSEAKVTYGVATVKLDSNGDLSVWLLDKDGNRLHDDYEPDKSWWFGAGRGVFLDYLIEDRENKINVINSDNSYNPNMYMENGILYYDPEPDSEHTWITLFVYNETFENGVEWWTDFSESVPYGVTDSGKNYCDLSEYIWRNKTYEIATVIDGRVYRTYYNYKRPDISAEPVSDITWSPEQPGIVTFKLSENADDYKILVEANDGNGWEYYGGYYDAYGGYREDGLKDCLTISGDIGILDFTNQDFIKDGYSYSVSIQSMSNDIERMNHGVRVESGEYVVNLTQNPPESNPTPEDPTFPTESIAPTEPDTKPDNPATSPDDKDDDSNSNTITVTGSSAEDVTERAAVVTEAPKQTTESSLNKMEASDTADETHLYLYMLLLASSFGIFAVLTSKGKQIH